MVLPDSFRGMGARGALRRPNSRATPQSLEERWRVNSVEPKIDLPKARRKDSNHDKLLSFLMMNARA